MFSKQIIVLNASHCGFFCWAFECASAHANVLTRICVNFLCSTVLFFVGRHLSHESDSGALQWLWQFVRVERNRLVSSVVVFILKINFDIFETFVSAELQMATTVAEYAARFLFFSNCVSLSMASHRILNAIDML